MGKTWYYSVDGSQQGPVEDPAFRALVEQGVVRADTLVWEPAMPDWQPYGQVTGTLAPPPVIPEPDTQEDWSDEEVVQIRQQHLKHEASLRSVGILYFLGSISFFVMAAAGITGMVSGGTSVDNFAGGIGEVAAGLIFGIGFLYLGQMFRSLSRHILIPGTILACLGLLAIPLGTIINLYILYLMHSKKGKMVLSPEYKEIIQQTPQIKYKTSPLVVGLLLILLAGLAFVFIMVIMGR